MLFLTTQPIGLNLAQSWSYVWIHSLRRLLSIADRLTEVLMEEPAFLQTKLQRPHIGDDLVSRPRLIKEINRGLERSLTLVSAPAGFGKTTLLSSWLQEHEGRYGWVSLDENDNDLGIFLRYFAAAIERVFPNGFDDILPLLNAPQLTPQDYLASKIVNKLAAFPGELILVLDDYQFIHDEAIHRVLIALIGNMPAQTHLMIATRKDPPFPLSILRGRRQMLEIRAIDLRFTPQETKVYLEGMLGEELDQNAITSLTNSTEGWITGLRLAALSLHGQADLKNSVGTLEGSSTFYVREYLFNEVFSRQPQEIQDFLLRTSVLNRFCSDLCDAVVGASNSHLLLERLGHPNLFLIYLDAERKWSRYHHLFRDMLRHRMKRALSKEEIDDLHRRASAWYRTKGMTEEALNHALAAEDTEGAADLVESIRHQLLNIEDSFTLERWLNKLPDRVVRERPVLLLARAWILELGFQAARIPPILGEVETLLGTEDALWTNDQLREALGEINALKSFLHLIRDESEVASKCALAALEQIPATHAFVRSIAIIVLAMAYQKGGQAAVAFRELRTFLVDTRADTIVARVLIAQIYIYILQGDLHQAENFLNQLRQVIDKKGLTISEVVFHWVRGRINYERNNLDVASKHLSLVFELRYNAQFIMVHDSMMALALIEHAQGNPENRQSVLSDLRDFSLERGMTGKLPEIDFLEARLMLDSQEAGRAIQLMRSIPSDITPFMLFFLEIPVVSKAQALIAQATDTSLHEATQLLEELQAYNQATHNTYQQIRILSCLAVAYQAQGRINKARNVLEQSLMLAQPGGFIRTFVDFGPRMTELLEQLADKGFKADYIRQILAAFPGQRHIAEIQRQAVVTPGDDLTDPLTRREREVLAFLGKWLSDKEIAQELVISPRTVKKHASNIYGKLGVKNRMQAVEKAKDLGLL
jgi:LuxR family maltose regulon positive regulatory protein